MDSFNKEFQDFCILFYNWTDYTDTKKIQSLLQALLQAADWTAGNDLLF